MRPAGCAPLAHHSANQTGFGRDTTTPAQARFATIKRIWTAGLVGPASDPVPHS
jgi:hypothetical protein